MRDKVSTQIITRANSSGPADELMDEFLVVSAKAMECSSALIVFREDAFLRSKYQYGMPETSGKSWTNEDLPHAVLAEITGKPVRIALLHGGEDILNLFYVVPCELSGTA